MAYMWRLPPKLVRFLGCRYMKGKWKEGILRVEINERVGNPLCRYLKGLQLKLFSNRNTLGLSFIHYWNATPRLVSVLGSCRLRNSWLYYHARETTGNMLAANENYPRHCKKGVWVRDKTDWRSGYLPIQKPWFRASEATLIMTSLIYWFSRLTFCNSFVCYFTAFDLSSFYSSFFYSP